MKLRRLILLSFVLLSTSAFATGWNLGTGSHGLNYAPYVINLDINKEYMISKVDKNGVETFLTFCSPSVNIDASASWTSFSAPEVHKFTVTPISRGDCAGKDYFKFYNEATDSYAQCNNRNNGQTQFVVVTSQVVGASNGTNSMGNYTEVFLMCSPWNANDFFVADFNGTYFHAEWQTNAMEEDPSSRPWLDRTNGYYRLYEIVSSEVKLRYNGTTANEGEAPAEQLGTKNEGITVAAIGTLGRTDFTFAGWTRNADGTGKLYQANDTIILDENTTLYAKWTGSPVAAQVAISFGENISVFNAKFYGVNNATTLAYNNSTSPLHTPLNVQTTTHSIIINGVSYEKVGDETDPHICETNIHVDADGNEVVEYRCYLKNNGEYLCKDGDKNYSNLLRTADKSQATLFSLSVLTESHYLDKTGDNFLKSWGTKDPVFTASGQTSTITTSYQCHLLKQMVVQDTLQSLGAYKQDYNVLLGEPWYVQAVFDLKHDSRGASNTTLTDNADMTATLTAGADPIGEYKDAAGHYINLVDTLRVCLTKGADSHIEHIDSRLLTQGEKDGLPYVTELVTRKTYHGVDVQDVILSAREGSSHEFTSQAQTLGETFTFNIEGSFADRTKVYDKDGNFCYDIIHGAADVSSGINLNATGSLYTILDENHNVSTEFSIVSHTGNSITVQANQNGNNTPRHGYLKIHTSITHNAVVHAVNLTIDLTQQSIFYGGQVLVHQKGFYNSLNAEGEQKVHTATKNIYARAGDNVQLRIQEQELYGWMRWYDYDTKNDISNAYTITQAPVNTGGSDHRPHDYHIIGSGSLTQGRYTIFSSNANSSYRINFEDKMTLPVVQMPAGSAVHRIACDVSNYIDYTPADTNALFVADVITEPTLSYRQIFALHPASEMAAALSACTAANQSVYDPAEKYYEDHTAIIGRPVDHTSKTFLLKTEYRFRNYRDTSELCYFYYDSSSHLKRVGKDVNAQWYLVSGTSLTTPSGSLIVNSDCFSSTLTSSSPDEMVFVLRTDNGINLARYILQISGVNKVGPLSETSNVAILTHADIETKYQVLARQDFNFGGSGTAYMHTYPDPLPWNECSYGYANDTKTRADNRVNRKWFNDLGYPNYTFPYFGEYVFINRLQNNSGGVQWLSNSWHMADIEQRGGAANGYMMFCDGTMESGIACELTIDANLCPGQKMYCSGWVANASTSASEPPSFSMKVQGKNIGDTEWTTVTEYLTGVISTRGTWQQIVFEVNLETKYDQYQLQVYNFASSAEGNDFVLDDFVLFATPNPITAFQTTSECGVSATTKRVVLRIDFDDINELYRSEDLYYRIKDNTNSNIIMPVDGYYGTPSETAYGAVHIAKSGDVMATPPASETYNTLTDLLAANDDGLANSGYVYEIADNEGHERYVFYIIHRAAMSSEIDYWAIVSNSAGGLDTDFCHLENQFTVTELNKLEVDGVVANAQERENLCGNTSHELGVRSYQINVQDENSEAHCYSDWLLYQADYTPVCGASYDQIENILRSLRSNQTGNEVNLAATNIHEVDSVKLKSISSNANAYVILNKLVSKKLVMLYQQNIEVYMPYGATARYFIFPIYGTGVSIDDPDQEVGICTEPFLGEVRAQTNDDNGELYIGNTPHELLPPALQLRTTHVRAIARDANTRLVLPITELTNIVIGDSVRLIAANDPEFNRIYTDYRFAYIPDKIYDFNGDNKDYYVTGNDIVLIPSRHNNFTLSEGYEYTFEVNLMSPIGSALGAGCDMGKILFVLITVPEYLKWTPSESDNHNWNTDDNWTAIDASGDETHVGGYVPLGKSSVLVPNGASGYPSINYATYDGLLKYDLCYEDRSCDTIRFMQNSLMLGQHYLNYNTAAVDMRLSNNVWNFISTPVKETFSGDMYMEETDPLLFKAKTVSAARQFMPAYIFQSFYNTTVWRILTTSGSDDEKSVADGGWAESNQLTLPLPVGSASAIYPIANSELQTIIRLPKYDERFYYYYSSGNRSDRYEPVSRTSNAGKLAVDKTDMPAGTTSITLNSNEVTNYFAFGNPSMAYIDMYKFIDDNSSVLEAEFQYFNTDGTSYISSSSKLEEIYHTPTELAANKDLFLAPMRGVVLHSKGPQSTQLTVTLNSDIFCIAPPSTNLLYPLYAPSRTRSTNSVLTITAETQGVTSSMRLVEMASASNSCVAGEDVCLLTANVAEYNGNTFSSPLNIYMAEDEYALSLNMKSNLSEPVPVCFAVSPGVFDVNYTTITFTGVDSFTEPLSFYDAETNTTTAVTEGLELKIDLPQNCQQRYFICGGPKENLPTSVRDLHSTGSTFVFDMLGRLIYQSPLQDVELVKQALPAGVYVIVDKDGVKKQFMK